MSTQRFRILAFGFAILILLPTLDQIFSFSARFRSTENRKSAPFPELSLQNLRPFVRQFNVYYTENFGFRGALVYNYSKWKFDLLSQSPLPEKVIVGKQGWLYLGNYDNHVIDQHRGLMTLSQIEARQIAHHLAYWQRKLDSLGTKLYVVIAPDTHSIYPEYLPSALAHTSDETRLDILQEAISEQMDVPFIDLRDTLRIEKSIHQVCYKTDSHWNNYGAFIGCAKLINRIRFDEQALNLLHLSEYKLVKTIGGGVTWLHCLCSKMR